jgi:phage shock protein A
MFRFFKRLFKIAEAEAHSAVAHLEDPVKMTEQGIRDLKRDLESSLHNLAQVKAVTIGLKRDFEQNKEVAADYEKKAVMLLQKAQRGELAAADADRLATEALTRKEQATAAAAKLSQDIARQEQMTAKLEATIQQLKSKIGQWEQEATTLKARAKVATASRKINQQLARVDADGTIAMLEKMRTKVAEEEALSESYQDIAQIETSVDSEIDKALAGSSIGASASLQDLKAKMGLLPSAQQAPAALSAGEQPIGALPADSLASLKAQLQPESTESRS